MRDKRDALQPLTKLHAPREKFRRYFYFHRPCEVLFMWSILRKKSLNAFEDLAECAASLRSLQFVSPPFAAPV
jgi:hypothetical protein